jgi:hypothetical protein
VLPESNPNDDHLPYQETVKYELAAILEEIKTCKPSTRAVGHAQFYLSLYKKQKQTQTEEP